MKKLSWLLKYYYSMEGAHDLRELCKCGQVRQANWGGVGAIPNSSILYPLDK